MTSVCPLTNNEDIDGQQEEDDDRYTGPNHELPWTREYCLVPLRHETAHTNIPITQITAMRSAVTNTPSNGTVSYEELKMCPNRPMEAGHWVHDDDNGVCIKEKKIRNFGLSISDLPLLISSTREDTPPTNNTGEEGRG